MAAITGAFIAGLMFGRTHEKHEINQSLHSLAYAFFVPIFFVNIGLVVDIRVLESSALLLFGVISLVAILGKIVGSGLGAKLGKLTWLESLQIGIGMVSRGEVGLIVAVIGLNEGLMTRELFSAIVGMVAITTLVTPLMLRAAFKNKSAHSPESQTRVTAD
jgi:Kef-type K+ transport system membrane component KefB